MSDSETDSISECTYCQYHSENPCCEWCTPDGGQILFTSGEMRRVQAALDNPPPFYPYHYSPNVLTTPLRPSSLQQGRYVCPFLHESDHLCTIYALRPLDCQWWPMVFVREPRTQNVFIAYCNPACCAIMDHKSLADLDDYIRQAVRAMTTPEVLTLVAAHPALIWEHRDDILLWVKDVTSLLSERVAVRQTIGSGVHPI